MGDIKFVQQIMGTERNYFDLGDCRYYPLSNGNRAKIYLTSSTFRRGDRLVCEIINQKEGKVDFCSFPFENYFEPVRCSPGAPEWFPHVEGGKWYFEQYQHCLPKESDFKAIRKAAFAYMDMFG